MVNVMHTGLTKQELIALLQRHGVMPTQQRVEIAQVLFARPQHLSAEQVLTMVNHERSLVSKATVYNTLRLFASKGLIREVIVDPTRVFYDPNTSEHHHFYHVDSGTLMDIDAHQVTLDKLPTLPPDTVAEGIDVVIRLRSAKAR